MDRAAFSCVAVAYGCPWSDNLGAKHEADETSVLGLFLLYRTVLLLVATRSPFLLFISQVTVSAGQQPSWPITVHSNGISTPCYRLTRRPPSRQVTRFISASRSAIGSSKDWAVQRAQPGALLRIATYVDGASHANCCPH